MSKSEENYDKVKDENRMFYTAEEKDDYEDNEETDVAFDELINKTKSDKVNLPRFGSDDFFLELKNGILNGDYLVYERLFKVIDRDIEPFLKGKLGHEEDRKDVMQIVKLEVYKSIVDFLLSSEGYEPRQRQSWLFRIVKGVIYDFYNKKNPYIKKTPKKEPNDDEKKIRVELIPFNSDDWDGFILDKCVHKDWEDSAYDDINFNRTEMVGVLISDICSLRSDPMRILMFLYSVIAVMTPANRVKSKPITIQDHLNGKNLQNIRNEIKSEFYKTFGYEADVEWFSYLDNRIELKRLGDKVFNMSLEEISEVHSAIRKALKRKRSTRLLNESIKTENNAVSLDSDTKKRGAVR